MSKKIYVGNLSYSTTEDELNELFSQYGNVNSVNIIVDRMTERSKGFGFVEMESESDAAQAISALNNTELNNREIRVNEAQEKRQNRNRF
jgi:RNA recognition motif-containing protein